MIAWGKSRKRHGSGGIRLAIGVLCAGLALARAGGAAEIPPQAADHWRALTRIDVDAAYDLLRDNHPGAVAAAGDEAFTSALAKAHAAADARIRDVASYQGYVATLGEFAGGLGDEHIGSHPLVLPRDLHWAGLVAARRGSAWVVGSDEPKIAGAELAGARIVSCDGTPADALASDRLRFRTDVSTEAFQVIFGHWLLLDDGNPFLVRPNTCTFEKDNVQHSMMLQWSSVGRDTFFDKYRKPAFGKAGFGLRPSEGGYWIALEQLDPRAQPVIDAVAAQKEKIRAAPFVVVDLRGNDGGDDSYGRALAEALYGPGRVLEILGPKANESGSCPSVFRASPGNIESTAAAAVEFRKNGDARGAEEYEAAIRAMREALAAGRPLAGTLDCAKKARSAQAEAPSLIHGRVFVVTDAVCFSSCIQIVSFFRQLGATQVGEATGAVTHYSEVREIVLPSGLSSFSTLQAIMPDAPLHIGPFLPKYEYDGDIADTATVEKWITGTIVTAK